MNHSRYINESFSKAMKNCHKTAIKLFEKLNMHAQWKIWR